MPKATLTINSRNYGSWSLRSWLLCRMAGLDFDEEVQHGDDPSTRAELLLLSPSFLVPRLQHGEVKVWDTMAIGEYLNELNPQSGLFPSDAVARAHCRSISAEMHAGFHNLRSALPMNIKGRHPGFKVFMGAQPDVDRILAIWNDCLETYGSPWLFGTSPTMADAMFAPVCSRFVTYDVDLDAASATYRDHIMAWSPMAEWVRAALAEPEEDLGELEVEF